MTLKEAGFYVSVVNAIIIHNFSDNFIHKVKTGRADAMKDKSRNSRGHVKWIDFVLRFWHKECVAALSLATFTDTFQKWCKRTGYKFSASDAERIHAIARNAVATLPKNDSTKHKGALVAYAGVDASPYQSGSFDSKSRHVSKRGSPHLRRVLFVIMSMTLIRANTANPVFCFTDKKRAEGKRFYVYTVAGSAKFLRIYYAKVKEYLNALEETA